MLITIDGMPPSRLTVVAYDIRAPRRARAVRRVLSAVSHAKQYSVYETQLGRSELRRVLTDVRACCDPKLDRLAVWWPMDGVRLTCSQDGSQIAAQTGGAREQPKHIPPNIGNFVLCFDISNAAMLRAVSAEIAAESAMLQRSVYWLRASIRHLTALLSRCNAFLETGDRLWAYPLGGSRALWQMNADTAPSLIPIATHHW